MCQLAEYRA